MIKNHIIYATFCDWTMSIKRAEGPYIWNEKNRRLIDFTSAWNVTNLGWNNPEVSKVMTDQIKKNTTAAMWMDDDMQVRYARALTDAMPKGLDSVIRATGGTDANEKALLVARYVTGRKKIIGFTDTYHGHSYGTISIGYRPEYIPKEAPVVPEFIKMDYPVAVGDEKRDAAALKKFEVQLERILCHEDVAAIVTESGIITGWGSTYTAPSGYLTLVRRLTKKYGTVMILDEIGTGFSRCGTLFGMELEGVVPDMVTFAKAMSNGAATMAAVVTKSSYGDVPLSSAKTHSTLAWMPVGVAASMKTLEIHKRDQVWETVAKNGSYLLQTLRNELENMSCVGMISGIGMEIGIHFVSDKKKGTPDDILAKKIIGEAYKNGLHLVFGGDGNIQIMPPLTTPKKVLAEGLDILFESIKNTKK